MWVTYLALQTRAGWAWPYTRPTLLYLLLAAVCLFGGALVFVAVEFIRERRSESQTGTPEELRLGPVLQMALQRGQKIAKSKGPGAAVIAVLIAASYWSGYSHRGNEMSKRTYVLNDVSVLRRDSRDKYLMQTAWGQTFEFKFCDDFRPEFPVPSRLKTIVYEDRRTCKSVADKQLGYILARDANGNLIIPEEGD